MNQILLMGYSWPNPVTDDEIAAVSRDVNNHLMFNLE